MVMRALQAAVPGRGVVTTPNGLDELIEEARSDLALILERLFIGSSVGSGERSLISLSR
jgi:hypothetical protein